MGRPTGRGARPVGGRPGSSLGAGSEPHRSRPRRRFDRLFGLAESSRGVGRSGLGGWSRSGRWSAGSGFRSAACGRPAVSPRGASDRPVGLGGSVGRLRSGVGFPGVGRSVWRPAVGGALGPASSAGLGCRLRPSCRPAFCDARLRAGLRGSELPGCSSGAAAPGAVACSTPAMVGSPVTESNWTRLIVTTRLPGLGA